MAPNVDLTMNKVDSTSYMVLVNSFTCYNFYITLFTVNGRKNRKNNSANSTHNMLTIYTIAYTIACSFDV